jgi:hypothetical protein
MFFERGKMVEKKRGEKDRKKKRGGRVWPWWKK